jgi:hypothetical protein
MGHGANAAWAMDRLVIGYGPPPAPTCRYVTNCQLPTTKSIRSFAFACAGSAQSSAQAGGQRGGAHYALLPTELHLRTPGSPLPRPPPLSDHRTPHPRHARPLALPPPPVAPRFSAHHLIALHASPERGLPCNVLMRLWLVVRQCF